MEPGQFLLGVAEDNDELHRSVFKCATLLVIQQRVELKLGDS